MDTLIFGPVEPGIKGRIRDPGEAFRDSLVYVAVRINGNLSDTLMKAGWQKTFCFNSARLE